MGDNLQTTFLNAFCGKSFKCQSEFRFITSSPNDNKSILVQVTVWCQTGDKPFPEPMMTQFTDTYLPPGLNVLIHQYILTANIFLLF